ncbi:hypothetical protein QQX98_000399 [Neonectria punicea]|uniref:Aminotransferase class I/classII large domain-containing protein n=1 Tax=Neonectria punicea TaxID=979145 RepID=A0ABR1HTD5_9HYPO
MDDLFRAEVNRRAIEAAFERAKDQGVTPPETLEVFMAFCGKQQLHFISDEIYAKSVFASPTASNPRPFVSSLTLKTCGVIDPKLVHVLYGASKDFCANGLRLGLVYTRNDGILSALSSISIFSWSPHITQDVWAAMLEDRQWLRSFMSKKNSLMTESYNLATEFLHAHGIRYSEMNASLFIWVDLRHLLMPQSSHRESGCTALRDISPEGTMYRKRELRIAEICTKNGVMTAPGSVYLPEEYGWFRITFTVGKGVLQEGLDRLWKSIVMVESEKREWE